MPDFLENMRTLAIATVWIVYWLSIWNIVEICLEHYFPITSKKSKQVMIYGLFVLITGSVIVGSNTISATSNKSTHGN